jgi:hypothetical protein
MPIKTGWGRHVDHSFDELGLLDLRVGIEASLELGARQAVASVEGWRPGRLRWRAYPDLLERRQHALGPNDCWNLR